MTKVDEATATKMKKAIAGSLGDDVKAEDITFTKVHFPVKAELKLTKTMAEVNADKPAFEKKFKKAGDERGSGPRMFTCSRAVCL